MTEPQVVTETTQEAVETNAPAEETDIAENVFSFLQTNGASKAQLVADHFGITKARALTILRRLRTAGRVMSRRGRGANWSVVE